MTLAEQTALPALLAEKVPYRQTADQVRVSEPGTETGHGDRGDVRGGDSIDDVDVVRCGGMKALFGGVYAPSTIGTLLREFSFGRARQLKSVLRHHFSALCDHVELLSGADAGAFIDIDSLLRPVYGHAKQGASYGAYQDRRQAAAAQRTLTPGGHDQHRYLCPGDRRDGSEVSGKPGEAQENTGKAG